MSETTTTPTTPTTTSGAAAVAAPTRRHRDAAARRLFEIEGRWLMGRVMPHSFLEGLEDHLRLICPGRERELVDGIRDRSQDLFEADQDMIVDGPSKGMLVLSAIVLAAYEAVLPELDGDQRRTIAFLQQVFGAVLERSVELAIKALAHADDPLDTLDAGCRKTFAMYGSYYDIDFERVDPATFEMRVGRCFFRDFFARHDLTPVTTVLCAWDANWMQALDPGTTGLVSARTSLLSLGHASCVFRVERTDDPLAAHTDALHPGPARATG
jgi:hypothetical protein